MKDQAPVDYARQLQSETIGTEIDCSDLGIRWLFGNQLPPYLGLNFRGCMLTGLALQFLNRGMAHILTLDHIDDIFGNILCMIANALDRLGNKQNFQ